MEVFRQKNVATRIVFPIVDADGDTVSAAAGLDSESTTWSDGANPGAFADLTNEATEIGTTGIYYLTLTAGEVNFDYIYVQVKTTTTGAKTQHILINTLFAPKADVNGRVDLGSWLGTAPNALVSSRVDASVGAMAASTLTAAAIATDAIAAAKIAAGAITAAKFAAGAIDAAAIANGAIDAATFAAGAIDAAAIAADAITAAKIAADVGAEIADAVWDEDIVAAHGTVDTAGRCIRTLDAISDRTNNANLNGVLGVPDTAGVDLGEEIADEVWDEATAGHTTAGSFGEQVKTDIDTLIADADDIQTRLPTALVSGRMDASVGAMASGVLTAGAIAADAITAAKVADGAIDAATFASGAIDAAAFAQGAADKVWSSATRTLTALGTDILTAASVSSGAANKIADHALRRTFGNARGSSDGDALEAGTGKKRSLLGLISKQINKWSKDSQGRFEFTQEDDATVFFRQTPTVDRAAKPIVGLE